MKKSITLFAFLILMMALSLSTFYSGLLLVDIPKAANALVSTAEQGTPTPPPPLQQQLSGSLPLPTITGSDMVINRPSPSSLSSSPPQQPLNIENNNNNNPSIQSSSGKGAASAEQISNQYIVVLKPNISVNAESLTRAELKSNGVDTVQVYNHTIKGYTIRVPNEQALGAIQNNPGVEFIEPDQKVKMFGQVLPTGIDRVDGDLSSAKSGHGISTVNAGIAIIDTGIDLTHPDLNVYRSTTFVPGTTSGNDDNGHGTHVAGIAAAKGIGVVGIAPGARLWAVKVLDSTGSGDISTVIAGVDYVTQHANEIDVANLSFGCECHSNALDTAIHNSVAAGITYVVAAGNGASNAIDFSPANHPDVITVSAIVDTDGKCGGLGPSTRYGNDDTFATFSNFGPVVAMAAPGVDIYSTYKDGSYATLSGTSMAAPHVAGAAALYKSTHMGTSPSTVKQALISTGSTPSTICDGEGHGYFGGEPGNIHEPLLDVGNF